MIFEGTCPRISDLPSKIEHHIQRFLASAENLPYDPTKLPILEPYPINNVERQELCEKLLREVGVVRALPDKSKQWDLDICGAEG